MNFVSRRAFLVWFCGSTIASLSGHLAGELEPLAVPDAELHQPTRVPDRIVLTWTGDPAATQAVTWRTSAEIDQAFAQLALATDQAQQSERQLTAATRKLSTDINTAHFHSVEFTELEPDTLYAYRVGDGMNWSEWFHFRTAKRSPARFTFLYFGDAQNDVRTHWSRVVREAFREAPRAAFTLHAGDLINRAQRDAEWGEWFGAPAWVNATIPVVPAPGNHEYFNLGAGPENERVWTTRRGASLPVMAELEKIQDAAGVTTGFHIMATTADGRSGKAALNADEKFVAVDDGFTALTGYSMDDLRDREPDNPPLRDRPANPGVRTLSGHWRPQFTLPANGPAGLEETVYHLDYQGARIVALNSNEQQQKQVAWLRSVLSNHPQRWTILTFHHPVFSPANGRDNAELRALWKPVIDEFKVDLVLTGHDHTYARSGDIGGSIPIGTENVPEGYNQVYDPNIGTVYVVSVSGPKMYDITSDAWAVRTAEDTQLFQVITVDGDELRFEARTAANRLYDAFTLKKREGMANELIELLPPERRRGKSRNDS
ncbi:MAG: fibronectin type III domain-containing protein [Opitutaceae bacterium]